MNRVEKDDKARFRFTLRALLLVVTAVAFYLAISRLADIARMYGESASLMVDGWVLILWFNAVLVLHLSGSATIHNAVVGGGLLLLVASPIGAVAMNLGGVVFFV